MVLKVLVEALVDYVYRHNFTSTYVERNRQRIVEPVGCALHNDKHQINSKRWTDKIASSSEVRRNNFSQQSLSIVVGSRKLDDERNKL